MLLDWWWKQRAKWKKKKDFLKKYGKWVLNFKESRLYPLDHNLQSRLLECVDSGVVEVNHRNCYCEALFGNGLQVKFWIANRMYAYCSKGLITDVNENKILFRWDQRMPEMWFCHMLVDVVENHNLNLNSTEIENS
jgi:hypothetical protein